MSQFIIRDPGSDRVLTPIIANNSEALLVGTPVSIDANGHIIGCTSSAEKVWGICIEDKTMTSDNETVAKYCPLIVNAKDIVIAYTDTGALAQTDIGEYGDVTSNTSGVIVMTNPTTAGQFILVGIDPDDSTLGYWMLAEPQQYAFAQA